MTRHALTIAPRSSRVGRALLAAWLGVCGLTGCSRPQAMAGTDIPSAEEAWVLSACSPVSPDFSTWTRHRVGGVSIAVPPGYIVEQGPPNNIYVRNAARRSQLGFNLVLPHEARTTFDTFYYRQTTKRNVCRSSLSGYPADVVGTFDRGWYGLIARWEAEWGGGDAGKWLLATIRSPRVEEARELRAVLHTIRPAGADN